MSKKTDKRLLASLDYIDDKFTERAAKRIKTRPVGVTGGVSKKRMIKYVTLLAACMILLGAAIPIVTSLLNMLPEIIDPSASSEETEKPEEYFSDCYFAGTNNVYKYEGQFIYKVREANYERIVKYDPVTGKVSGVCLDRSCDHTYLKCPLASSLDGHINNYYVLEDWLIYNLVNYQSISNDQEEARLCLYNMKTGESRTIFEKTQTDNIIRSAITFLPFDGKVYISISEKDISDPKNKMQKEYIVSYDPETEETVYLCDEPENLGFIGISNKRLFYVEKLFYNWSSDYSGENLKKEETFTFVPLAVSGTYAYDFTPEDDDDNPNTMNVYDLETDSVFKIDFGGDPTSLCILEDELLYVINKSEDQNIGAELWRCDKRGENRQLLLKINEKTLQIENRIGNYIIGKQYKDGVAEHYIINTETGEIKAIPKLTNTN